MGVFTVRIDVGDPTGQRFERLDALVDTGSTNTVIPEEILRSLGVAPHTRSSFELADGSETELDVGRTWVRLNGQAEFTQVVFGEQSYDPILGAITLEEMGLVVDPIAQRLTPRAKYLK